jgi:large subunit ribosomal protein L13
MQLERITNHTKPVDRDPSWLVIDAGGERLGRLASRIANALQGKDKADYSRHQISGDFVIVLNASKVDISGNKGSQKIYYRHTGYVGHLRERTFNEMLARFPGRVIEMAVKGMLPRNRLGRQMFRRLKVYAGGEHPHEAQVNAGLGTAKQAPAAAATRRKAGAKSEKPGTSVQAAAGETEATSALSAADRAAHAAEEVALGIDEEEKA